MATALKAASKSLKEKLPEWDLTDLYPHEKAVHEDIQKAQRFALDFAKAYQGKVDKLTAEELARAITSYEELTDIEGRLYSYADLTFASNMADPKIAALSQNIREKVTEIASLVQFFTLDLNKLAEADLEKKLTHKALQYYAPWIRDVRTFKPYQLSDEIEKLLLEKSPSGRAAWNRLFDETITGLRFPVNGRELTMDQALHLLSDRKEKTRKAAAKSIGKVLEKNIGLFALITNTIAKDKQVEDRWRGFENPISERNVYNRVEDEVVDALLTAVKASYKDISHRYYKYKAKAFGKKALDYWDRNAPWPQDDDKAYGWDEAVNLVLDAYGAFSPRLRELGKTFFDKPWVDASVRPGKASGAFAHPTVPSAHPYLLVNFQGKARDVMTLAHELGHGVHQVLAAKQGTLMCDTPLTLAETASVFGEQLTFRRLLNAERDEKRRKLLIAAKVEDMINTVVRQVAFLSFEQEVHKRRREGELTAEQISDIWMGVQKESLGSGIRFSKEYRYFWAYIPHFIHTPFYVYAYAFGDLLVNALYSQYLKGMKGFDEKYFTMLEAGGTLLHKELLAPFGLDATDPRFWQQGLSVIKGFVDELLD